MDLKNKVKDIWKRVSELEGGQETAKNLTKDKGRIPFKDISQKLKTVMKDNVDVVGRKIIIPSYYIIYCNEADRKLRIEVEEVVCEELKEELYHEIRKINPEQNKRDLVIQFQIDLSIPDGQFRIENHIKKTDTGEQSKEDTKINRTLKPERESDNQQTVVEQSWTQMSDDDQKTVVQKLEEKVFYKLLIDSGEETREVAIMKESISIGRGSKDDVVLQSPDFSISRTHATIAFKDGHYSLMPLGVNSTFLNGQELELNKAVPLSAGDEIKIMNYRLKIIE